MFHDRVRILFSLALVVLIGIHVQTAAAHEICFPSDKTPHCLADLFSDYWEQNGGLEVFGYPITSATKERNRETRQIYLTQWMERNRLEYHPEEPEPYRVALGLLGKERLAQLGRDWVAEGRERGPQAGCLWFEETGHNVCNQDGTRGFKTYWETHGLDVADLDSYACSLQLFGLPLTAPRLETNSSGDRVLTQWFERARFEWHPDNPDAYAVQLGLLGKEIRSTIPPPPPTPRVRKP